jgi:glutamyl/glutaminyl-tRNA synthetase
MYAKRYKGKCILRFEDTNPEKVHKEYVDAMKEDVLEYLDIKPDKVVFSSNDMPKMYGYAEKIIKDGKAYVCTCTRDRMQELRH